MTKLTKLDIAAIRAADTLCVHLHAEKPDGLVRLIKRADTSKPFSEDKEHVLNCAVKIHGWHNQRSITNGAKCFSHVSLYPKTPTPAGSVLGTIRVGDEVTFLFYPDAHLNEYARKHDLHADVLQLEVRRGDKRFLWQLDSQICPENSARMCHGVDSRKE